jgi:hypothetical protein
MTDTDNLSLIPEEAEKRFAMFLLFIEFNGPGPEPSTDEPPLSPEQRAELQMFDRFLEARQAPDWLRRRIKRRYIEEKFLKSKEPGLQTWGCRFISVSMMVTTLGFYWYSPEELVGYTIPIIVIISALFFLLGEIKNGAVVEIWMFRLSSASILALGIGDWWYWSSTREFSDFAVPVIVIMSALIFWLGERRKR